MGCFKSKPREDNRNQTQTENEEIVDYKNMTDEEWAQRLSPEVYTCTRKGGTEQAFSGEYVNNKAVGVYKCACCGSELFTSKSKYDSHSGWPSFHSPYQNSRILRRKDVSLGMDRVEILCANCNAHLGHVFDDGPPPTGERYCINSLSLKFTARENSELKLAQDNAYGVK